MPDPSRPRGPSNAPSQVRTRAPASTTATTTTTGVRRNLFQSQLTRRPTPSSASTSTETLRLDSCVDVLSDSDEIVVRDKQAELEVGEAVAGGVEDEAEDGVVDEKEEMERERKRLADAVKLYQMNQGMLPEATEVLLESVKASLRSKVVALADDNWMFEAESQTRH
ncbi:hypothetical protein jhhlp_002576 [Lomentospora prolificans]|uniref:Uncharacterized protein n=1 Tax=Lomentospora prolificans TaxID=41688 RepID=A0A2N3NEG2_9PEZI|nr:hypothetical protein jhhlp_002576 [Lomentospora prolificans]